MIIRIVTKKVLFFGLRNKFCCVCYSAKNVKESGIHHCFLNWNEPSTAMKADIIVDGFKNSMKMHVIYLKLIGKKKYTYINK